MTEIKMKAIWDGLTNTWSELEMTPEEIAADQAAVEAFAAAEAERLAAAEALATLKASARAKLIAGEPLTEEEAATIVI
jgi:hypothetical protein